MKRNDLLLRVVGALATAVLLLVLFGIYEHRQDLAVAKRREEALINLRKKNDNQQKEQAERVAAENRLGDERLRPIAAFVDSITRKARKHESTNPKARFLVNGNMLCSTVEEKLGSPTTKRQITDEPFEAQLKKQSGTENLPGVWEIGLTYELQKGRSVEFRCLHTRSQQLILTTIYIPGEMISFFDWRGSQ